MGAIRAKHVPGCDEGSIGDSSPCDTAMSPAGEPRDALFAHFGHLRRLGIPGIARQFLIDVCSPGVLGDADSSGGAGQSRGAEQSRGNVDCALAWDHWECRRRNPPGSGRAGFRQSRGVRWPLDAMHKHAVRLQSGCGDNARGDMRYIVFQSCCAQRTSRWGKWREPRLGQTPGPSPRAYYGSRPNTTIQQPRGPALRRPGPLACVRVGGSPPGGRNR
jgi:hypothetical protein